MVRHLDNCLGCMACVTACPSGVQYDKLIEDTRAQVERNWERDAGDKWFRRLVFALFPHPRRLRALVAAHAPRRRRRGSTAWARGCRSAGSPRWPRWRRRRAGAITRARAACPPPGESRGTVALLQGCVQRVFFAQVNAATAALLAAEGWDVHAPEDPHCCGALRAALGHRPTPPRERAKETIAALEGYDRVVTNAAGCGSAMKDYGHVLRDDPEWAERAEAFAEKVCDVTRCSPRASRARRGSRSR